jgi:hypothetical protein
MNIKFSYLYRDGSNYKNYNQIVFSNPNSRPVEEIKKLIHKELIDDKWFYCAEWKIPDIHFKEFAYNSEVDVDWHEFEDIEETTEGISQQNSIEDFLMLVNKTKST